MKYTALLLGCLIVIAASALQGMSQWDNLTGARVPRFVPAPLNITTPAINARTTRTDRSSKGWLSQPLVQVENVSNKPIEYLTIEITLPGVTDSFMLAYGKQPGKPADNSIQALQPGQKINLIVNQHACELKKKSLRYIDSRTLDGNQATARINGVIFNDETAWFYGVPHVMEPNNPLVWNVARNTSTAAAATDSPTFNFLKVGLREPSIIVCWTIIGTGYVDCCGIQQATVNMVKGTGDWSPERHNEECCNWTAAVECNP
jgi:hypothetical protein